MSKPDFEKDALNIIHHVLRWGETMDFPSIYFSFDNGMVKTTRYSEVVYDYLDEHDYEFMFKRGEKGTTDYFYGNGDNVLILTYDDSDRDGKYILKIGSDDAENYYGF